VLRLRVAITPEGFNEATSEFVSPDFIVLELEHSLVSVSKWESKWEIPFLSTDDKTEEQALDYVRMMYLGDEFPEHVTEKLTEQHYNLVASYINAKMTATWFREEPPSPSREVVTAELIYYWMIAHTIPIECQYWHLNRLLTLIKICNIKNNPEKKGRRESAADRRRRNQEMKAKLGTAG